MLKKKWFGSDFCIRMSIAAAANMFEMSQNAVHGAKMTFK